MKQCCKNIENWTNNGSRIARVVLTVDRVEIVRNHNYNCSSCGASLSGTSTKIIKESKRENSINRSSESTQAKSS